MLKFGNTFVNVGGTYLTGIVSPPVPPEPTPSFDEVTIGTQTWMAKNLAIDDGGEGITIVDNVTANGVNFGTQYYYTFDAALRVANSIIGWHLPSKEEWDVLVSYCGESPANKLKSTSGWTNNGNGTDDYGFNALPCGLIYLNNGNLGNAGNSSNFWTSTYQNATFIYYVYMFYYLTNITTSTNSKTYAFSVRLIKD
jgi:uncharacterized protein (TIGR02145 family)